MAINLITMALMPISQGASWYMIIKQSFYPSIFKISIFYAVWALYNRFLMGATLEMGHYSMGIMAVCSVFQKRSACMIACALVLVNFLAFAYWILLLMGPHELAAVFKHDITKTGLVWAWTFKAYFVSQISLWSFIMWKLIKEPSNRSYEPILG